MLHRFLTFIGYADAGIRLSDSGNLLTYRIGFYEKIVFGKIRMRRTKVLSTEKSIGTGLLSAAIVDLKTDAAVWIEGGKLPQGFVRVGENTPTNTPFLRIVK